MNTHAILGTDFSKAISEIITHSKMLKSIGIQKITLVHVLNLRDVILINQVTIEDLEKKLSDQKDLLSNMGFDVEAELIFGVPHIELERKRNECGATITIFGSHGRTSPSSMIGGTTADILQNLRAPVLLIPLKKKQSEGEEFQWKNLYQYEQIMQQLEKQEPDWDLKCNDLNDHVLLPTDFSDFSEEAYQWLKNRNIKLPKVTLLHVQDEVKIARHLDHKLEEFNKIDAERLTRLSGDFKSNHPETDISFDIKYGKPIQVILNYIIENKVTLTIMGSQGRGFINELFIGSVSHQVARNSSSNVLIVPIPKDR